MDLNQAKILLEKINALYRSINMDGGKMASIERDLMLNYVRQLYETFLDTGNNPSGNSSTSHMPPLPEKEIKKRAPRIMEVPEQKETAVRRPEPKPEPKIEAKYEPEPTPLPKEEPRVDVKPGPKAEPQPTRSSNNPKLDELFQFKEAKELSEKLSERPVTDLTKSMALNDRLLYINDLFNKDQEAFNNALNLFNKFNGMQEAGNLLKNYAEQYNWLNDEKKDTAQAFIRLVRRRYI